MPTATGHDAPVHYVWEPVDDFATSSPSDSDSKPFGYDATLDTSEGSNEAVRVFEPDSRQAQDIVEQMFNGSFSVSFELTNPWWLGAVIGDPTTSGSAVPYTHTYSTGPPKPMQITQGNRQTGSERVLMGCVVESASISAQVDGMCEVSLDGAYAMESPATSVTDQPPLEYNAFVFHMATVQRPSGTTLALTQEADLSISNNIDIIGELGTRFGVDYSPKQLEVDIDYTRVVNSEDDRDRMYGGGSEPAAVIENQEDIAFYFEDPHSGNTNTLEVTMNDAFPDSMDRSGAGDPEADLEDSLTELSATTQAVAETETETAR